jgi:glycosyltransferase involved in cell wall biosynthesis
MSRQIMPIRDLFACMKMFLFFLKKRFDIVHVHTPKGGAVGLLAAFMARLPVRIYTIHGLPLETASGFKRRLLWLVEKLSCSLSTHILAVSESLRKKIIQEKLCRPEKIAVLENGTACGIDIIHFSPDEHTSRAGLQIRRQFGIPEEDIVIGFLGRLTPEKGVDTLIRSFLELENEHENLVLLLVGDLDEVRETFEQDLLNIIMSHRRIIHVEFQEDVVPFYAAMNLYVMPTRREGFGMTFLEAGAMNLPVIGTQVTGCVDAVDHGNTGLLVNPDDPKALKAAIFMLINDKELRLKLGRQGRERVEQLFPSKRLVQAHIDLYNQVLSGNVITSDI